MLNWVGPRYFETLGTPFIAGRDFLFQDEARPRVAIVNQAMARHYFAGASPIGRHLTFDGDQRPYEIVGLVSASSGMRSIRISARRRPVRCISTRSRTGGSPRSWPCA